MSLFVGLDDILKCVIRNTAYLSASGEEENVPEEKRYHDALKALFGDFHPDEYLKPPKGFSFHDILWACDKKAKGESFEGAVKELVASKLKKPIKPRAGNEAEMDRYYAALSNYEGDFVRMIETVLGHYKRHRKFYDSKGPALSSPAPANFPDIEQDRKKVLSALRETGWPL